MRYGRKDQSHISIVIAGATVLMIVAALMSGCVQSATTCGEQVCAAGSECSADGNACIRDDCGNGNLDRGEQCDDGNVTPGDGCGQFCGLEVTAGGNHVCALIEPSTVRCWGRGWEGQLGQGYPATIGDDELGLARGIHLGGVATRLAAGGEHTCALMDTGGLRCWGSSNFGQLGYGNRAAIGDDEHPSKAGDIPLGDAVIQVATGRRHTCALMAGGAVRCWGLGEDGRLGYGNQETVGDDEPVSAAGELDIGGNVIQLVAGGSHTCALLDEGTVRCWGNGDQGRLGYGNTLSIGDDEPPSAAGDLNIGGTVVELAAGDSHTCARLDTGAVRCWGQVSSGRLGQGSNESVGDDETPAEVGPVEIGGMSKVIQLATGHSHTCALLDTGAVRCWGYGQDGRLGHGNTLTIGDDELPSTVGDVQVGGKATKLVAGGSHTCVLTDAGAVRCWGDGLHGRLGYGSEKSIGDDETPSAIEEIDVGGSVAELAAGARHTCALLDTGRVRCWGNGVDGKLGNASIVNIGDNESPSLAYGLDFGDTVKQLVAGLRHNCALLASGAVHCWGDAGAGQLGQGDRQNLGDNGDLRQAGNVVLGSPALAVASGYAHSCAIVKSGAVRCWGNNRHGQLGQGHTETIGARETPDVVQPLEFAIKAMQIVAGARHTCALMDGGQVYCWGSNEYGQLGHGEVGSDALGDDEHPAAVGVVALGGKAAQLAAGAMHTCALLESGDMRCWGRADFGQLGYGATESTDNDTNPASTTIVPVGGQVRQITAGESHTCALLDGGDIRCWGLGTDGRLGHGANDSIGDDEPADAVGSVALPGPAGAVAAGESHTCAILTNGDIYCWGLGKHGRLGYGNTNSIGDDETPIMAGPVPSF